MADAPPADPNRPQPAPLAVLAGQGHRGASLPVPLTSFVGREREAAALSTLLRRSDVRLVTLTGPGGVGKTRLALAVATAVAGAFVDGVRFVPLAPVTDPTLVLPAMAHVLGIRDGGEGSLVDQLTSVLMVQPSLMVLDNFERVVEAAPVVSDLLSACPELVVLVTSRVRLRLSGEREYAVAPLALPRRPNRADLDVVATSDAIRLFGERAQAVKTDFVITEENVEAIAAICDRLDGLPLAIELAAARVKVLPPAALLGRLERRLPLLTGGGRDLPDRQQTMRGAIAWSFDLLPSEEQTLFRTLAVFVGGFTFEAAESIATGNNPMIDVLDGVASLLDKSLLREEDDPDGKPRYWMLETVREFALERLAESGETETVRERHAGFFLAAAERAVAGTSAGGVEPGTGPPAAELGNVREALAWLLDQGEGDSAVRLAGALIPVWTALGHVVEGRQWLFKALIRGAGGDPVVRARAAVVANPAALFTFFGGTAEAVALGEEALTTFRNAGDHRGEMEALVLL
ncbi:MAG: protein kinase, partial [Chloroflexia bacterium]|nr:protein kinase [Chloroflexia bacterium]